MLFANECVAQHRRNKQVFEAEEVITVRGNRAPLIQSMANKRYAAVVVPTLLVLWILVNYPIAPIADFVQRVITGIQIIVLGEKGPW